MRVSDYANVIVLCNLSYIRSSGLKHDQRSDRLVLQHVNLLNTK